jgi:hypothetical protein
MTSTLEKPPAVLTEPRPTAAEVPVISTGRIWTQDIREEDRAHRGDRLCFLFLIGCIVLIGIVQICDLVLGLFAR